MQHKCRLQQALSAVFISLVLFGCKKSDELSSNPATKTETSVNPTHHVYGLLDAKPEQYANVPKFSMDDFKEPRISNAATTTTTTSTSLTLSTPAVRDQGQIGSCTAFCGTESYEIGYYYKNGAFPSILSPAFLYYEERVNIEGYSISSDPGAYMVDIPEALEKYGICLETLMTYPSSDVSTAYKTAPTAAAISNALGYTVSSYKLITSGDTAAVKTCLKNNIPVMMGFEVYDNTSTYAYFEELNTTSYTYNPLSSSGSLAKGLTLLGGHAVPIVGYDDTKKAFLCENSWSASWGLNGFFYIPYTVFMSKTIVPSGEVYYMGL